VLVVSVVVPSRNNFEILSCCLSSLQRQAFEDFEIVVVDNNSTDGSPARLKRRFPHVRLIEVDHNAFFCESVNIGVREARGKYIALVNDDTEFDVTWLSNATAGFSWDSDIGSVASKILSLRDMRLIDSAGDHLASNGYAGNIGWSLPDDGRFSRPDEVFSACAAGALYDRRSLIQIGGFDESFIAYYDDIDVGFRLQLLGFRCVYNPDAVMYHYGGGSKKRLSESLRLLERNMVLNLAKNMPTPLLKKYRGSILMANALPIELYKWTGVRWRQRYVAWLRGKLGSLPLLREAYKRRRLIQATRRVSISYLDNLLQKYPTVEVFSDMLPIGADDIGEGPVPSMRGPYAKRRYELIANEKKTRDNTCNECGERLRHLVVSPTERQWSSDDCIAHEVIHAI
jgi:GT2 family glycosyltransferase